MCLESHEVGFQTGLGDSELVPSPRWAWGTQSQGCDPDWEALGERWDNTRAAHVEFGFLFFPLL